MQRGCRYNMVNPIKSGVAGRENYRNAMESATAVSEIPLGNGQSLYTVRRKTGETMTNVPGPTGIPAGKGVTIGFSDASGGQHYNPIIIDKVPTTTDPGIVYRPGGPTPRRSGGEVFYVTYTSYADEEAHLLLIDKTTGELISTLLTVEDIGAQEEFADFDAGSLAIARRAGAGATPDSSVDFYSGNGEGLTFITSVLLLDGVDERRVTGISTGNSRVYAVVGSTNADVGASYENIPVEFFAYTSSGVLVGSVSGSLDAGFESEQAKVVVDKQTGTVYAFAQSRNTVSGDFRSHIYKISSDCSSILSKVEIETGAQRFVYNAPICGADVFDGLIYIADYDNGGVVVINATTGEIVDHFADDNSDLGGVTIDRVAGELYVAEAYASGDVPLMYVYDLETYDLLRTIELPISSDDTVVSAIRYHRF